MQRWLEGELVDRICFAVGVEETDAWLLAHWDEKDHRDPCRHTDPKSKLREALQRLKPSERAAVHHDSKIEQGQLQSRPLRTKKVLEAAAARCRSLRLFIDSLPAAVDG